MNRLRKIGIAVMFGSLLATALASPSFAEGAGQTTSSIVIEDSVGASHSVLRLNFDKPIPVTKAHEVKSSLQAEEATQPQNILAPTGDALWCWGSISDQDANAIFDIQYSCNSPRTLAWGLTLKPASSGGRSI